MISVHLLRDSWIREAKHKTVYKDLAAKTDILSENCLVGIEAVKECKRPHHPPLLWFHSRYECISNDREVIKHWIAGTNRTIINKDLITNSACMAGFEADFVIYLGSDNVSAMMSRCRGQFVHIEWECQLI